MKKFKAGYVVFVFFLSLVYSSQPVKADENQCNNELQITEQLVVDGDSLEPLYNIEDDIVAYYLEGNNAYAIIGVDGTLIEYSDNFQINGYDNNDSDKSYYAGFGEYYVESTKIDEIENIFTDEVIKKNNAQDIKIEPEKYITSKQDQDVIKTSDNKKSVTITYPNGGKDPKGNTTYTTTLFSSLSLKKKANLPYNTRYFSYNQKGTCGSTAVAIMMYYYYDHIGKSYIKNSSYIGTTDTKQKAFVAHFKSLLGDDGNGTGYSVVEKGINKYLAELGKSKNCTYITSANVLNAVSSKIISCIDNKKPCIVGLSNEPTYGNHWVVGIGYADYYGYQHRRYNHQYFIKVNNGWYKSANKNVVYVNYDYIDGVIYLK